MATEPDISFVKALYIYPFCDITVDSTRSQEMRHLAELFSSLTLLVCAECCSSQV